MNRMTGSVAAALTLAAALSACASGGGGGGSGPVSPPPTSPPASPPPSPPPPPPASFFENIEYNRDYSKALIHASAAYAAGATGAGVTIAVIDTGVDREHAEFIGAKIATASVDIYAGTSGFFDPTTVGSATRDHLDDEQGHGTGVASAAAGAKLPEGDPLLENAQMTNGFAGMHGVAFDSTILAVRADDTDPACAPNCDFDTRAIAAAIDYARVNGADIINLSLGGDPTPSPDITAALQRAVKAGVIIVASAGNDGNADPDAPANFAATIAANGRAVAVGAVDSTSTISSFSNRAGTVQDFYVVAPGEDVVVAVPVEECGLGGNTCYNVVGAGTSFASPQVAGALALLLDGFPALAPEDAVTILFTSAADLGAAGTDAIYGQGLIDLEAAFAPIGTTSITFDGGTFVPLDYATADPSGATGDWITASGLLDGAIMRDGFRRAYHISPESAPAPSSAVVSFESAALAQRIDARRAAAPLGGDRFGYAFFRAPDDAYLPRPDLADERALTPELSINLRQGPLSFAMGRGFAPPAPLAPSTAATLTPSAQSGAIAALTGGGDWASLGYDMGAWTLSMRAAGDEERSLSAATIARRFGAHVAGLEVGSAQEADASLGGLVSARLGGEEGASTSFAALGWSGPVAGAWRGGARVEAASATLDLPAHVRGEEDLLASAWTLSLERPVFRNTSSLAFTLAQPLRAEAGRVSLLVPVDVTKVNASIYEERSASLTPSGREIDLESSLRFGLAAGAEGRVAVRLADDPGHVATAEPEAAAWFGVRWTR